MAEELRILYEDPYLVVCVKPVGVLSEDSESGRSLPRMLAEHYRQAGKPDYIATVHRLDKIVGGVMVLSRDGRSQAG
ncbi:MAG: pseudouridine synthase [Oscillospiraceae bacterium]